MNMEEFQVSGTYFRLGYDEKLGKTWMKMKNMKEFTAPQKKNPYTIPSIQAIRLTCGHSRVFGEAALHGQGVSCSNRHELNTHTKSFISISILFAKISTNKLS